MPLAAFAISLAVVACGFLLTPTLHGPAWTPVGLRRLGVYCLVFLGLLPLRRAAARIAPSFRPSMVAWFGAIALIYGTAAVGAGPFAGVALFCLAALALGGSILDDSRSPSQIALCLCLGEGLIGFAAALLGRTRLCYPAVFIALLAVPVLARRRWLADRLGRAWRLMASVDAKRGTAVAMAALVFAVGMQFLLVLKPEVGTDSLAMHLALPAYVAIHHHGPQNVAEFLWALMPQTADWCYAAVYPLGGEYAARLLNLSNLLIILALLYSFLRRYCSQGAALAVCALFATGPLVEVVTGSLFIDNFEAALLFASCASFLGYMEEDGARLFVAGWLFLGLALSSKAGAAAFVPGLAALAVYSAWKRPPGWRTWAAAAVCGLSIGLYFYAAAFLATGNPVFPYANEIFHSRLIPAEPIAPQFREPLTWRTPWDLTFHSSRFIEGTGGAMGFGYILLVPAGLAAMIRRRNRAAWWAVAVALSAALLSFLQISYLRYLYPSLLVLMIPVAFWLDEERRAGGHRAPLAYGGLAAAAVLNILFQPAAGWYHREFVWNQIWNPEGSADYVRRYAPARNMVEALNLIAPGEPALICEYDHVAGLAGPAYSTNWHMHLRNRQLVNSLEALDVLRFVNEKGIRYIASPSPAALDTWPRALPAFFDDFTEAVFSSGEWVLYRVTPEFSGRGGLQAARELMEHPPAAGPGTYDDLDIRVMREGYWFRNNSRGEPLYHTLTESGAPGAGLSFMFRGSRIACRFARDRPFGIAEVSIDGAHAGEIDEYAPAAVFGQRREFDCAAAGVHTLRIRVTGRKNAASSGVAIVSDGFEVSGENP